MSEQWTMILTLFFSGVILSTCIYALGIGVMLYTASKISKRKYIATVALPIAISLIGLLIINLI